MSVDANNVTTTQLEESFARSYGRTMKNVVEAVANGTYKKNPNSAAEFRAKMKKWREEAENEQRD